MASPAKQHGFLNSVMALCLLASMLLTSFAPAFASAASAAASSASAYVRQSPRDPHYFELTNGQPYIPNGFNLVGAPRENDLERVLDTMAANRINYCRVWIDQAPFQVEHAASGVYDEARAQSLKRFLDLAGARGIRVKLCLEYFRDIKAQRTIWSDNLIHHQANGGPFASMEGFLYTPEGQARFKRKLAFYQSQIGDHPAIFAWELWNEMNAVRGADWSKWTAQMLPELHRLFPKNMAVQSLGSFDRISARAGYRKLLAISDNDVTQVHRYLDQGADLEVCHGPVDELGVDAVRELLAMNPGRPVILAETGAVKPKHTGVSELYAKDKDGMILHDILFAPFFAGAAGTGAPWWWQPSIERPNLWYHFARFARAVEGIDPPAERFSPVTIEHPRLKVLMLKGQKMLLAWCRDKQNDWRSELERGEAPERLTGQTLDLAPQLQDRKVKSAQAYNPWSDTWSELALKDGKVTLPPFQRSIVVKLELQ